MSGGAWKVAYADFVTAMMALFMVLWISAQDEEILIATAQYFQNPFSSPMDATSGILDEKRSNPNSKMSMQEGDSSGASDPNSPDIAYLNSLAQEFYRLLNLDEDFEKRPIDIEITSDGLRLSLFDHSDQPFFKPYSAEFTEWGSFVLENLAWVIDRHRFHVVIEGHTPRDFVMPTEAYSVWELSADRANSARRALTRYAVRPERIDRVVGLADREPARGFPPDSDSNQRVTLGLTIGDRSSARTPSNATSPPSSTPSSANTNPPRP